MTLRTPYDGAPYYCAVCGAGFYKLLNCDRPDCEREDVREAERRRDNLRKQNDTRKD